MYGGVSRMDDMNTFRAKLEELKKKGADVDPDAIIADLTTPPTTQVVETFEESFDKMAFAVMKEKVIKLLDDFEKFYGPKGRGLSIALHVQKENSADRFSESFPYTDKLSIVNIVDIGTKGKYSPVEIVVDDEMIAAEKQKIAERDARRMEK